LIDRHKEAYLPNINCKQNAKYEENIVAHQSANPLQIPGYPRVIPSAVGVHEWTYSAEPDIALLASNSPTVRCN
jgi:hypothetical protein